MPFHQCLYSPKSEQVGRTQFLVLGMFTFGITWTVKLQPDTTHLMPGRLSCGGVRGVRAVCGAWRQLR